MRRGLRFELLLALAGLVLLAFVLLFSAVASLLHATLQAEQESHARIRARSIATAIAEPSPMRGTTEDLNAFLNAQIRTTPGLCSVAVYDQEGRLSAQATDPTSPRVPPALSLPAREEQWKRVGCASGHALEITLPGPRGAVVIALRTDTGRNRTTPLFRLIGFYTAAVAVTLLVFSYIALTRLVVQPIGALTAAARRVAQGARSLDIPRRGARELLELGVSLSEMTTQLLTEEETLKKKIAELTQATTELTQAHQQMLRSERLASVGKLASGVAHEIGNPLSAIMGLQDLLLEGGLGPTETQDFLERMRKETERIARIVRSLLDLARPANSSIATPRCAEGPNRADVERAVMDVVALLRPQKHMRDANLSVEVPSAPEAQLPAVALGQEQMVQVLLNLVLNAVDAIAPDGRIVIRAHAQQGRVCVEVEDDGPGLDPHIVPSLFEPFTTTKDVGKGTGLGLALCRGLVDDAGGTITIANRRDGQSGVNARVELPIAAP